MAPSADCTKIIHHLNRIQGQIESLKRAVEDGKSCEDVAQLTNSILSSFDSARATIIETSIIENVLGGRKASADKSQKLTRIISLYKT